MRIPTSIKSSLALASLLFVLGCPKDEPTTNATPGASPTATAEAMASAHATPAPAGATFIRYKWAGGLSIYHHYELTVRGTETAEVSFTVKPMRTEEKTVTDTLDAAQFAELKAIFDAVKFDEVKTAARKVMIMDIGQREITREIAGGPSKTVIENPNTQATTDIRPLLTWMDEHVRLYLDKAGVAPGKRPTPVGSPIPSPAASPRK